MCPEGLSHWFWICCCQKRAEVMDKERKQHGFGYHFVNQGSPLCTNIVDLLPESIVSSWIYWLAFTLTAYPPLWQGCSKWSPQPQTVDSQNPSEAHTPTTKLMIVWSLWWLDIFDKYLGSFPSQQRHLDLTPEQKSAMGSSMVDPIFAVPLSFHNFMATWRGGFGDNLGSLAHLRSTESLETIKGRFITC